MEALRLTTTFGKDGSLELPMVKGAPGEQVEVIVLFPSEASNPTRSKSSMLGSVKGYIDPQESAASAEEWDAVRDPDSVANPNPDV